jgi:transposase
MFYVGLDVHSKWIVICVLNGDGKVVERQRVRQVDQLLAVLERLPRYQVCFEASCGYGGLYDALEERADRVVVAHPGRLRWIFRSRRKNDRVDAERLAKLLFLDEVPGVHVPRPEVRAWRELVNFRRRLVEKRSRAKNGLRALLRSRRLRAPFGAGLRSRKALAWIKSLAWDEPMQALRRDLLVEEIETLSAQITRVEEQLERFSKHQPAVWQLESIPGVGRRTAEAVVAFLDDPHRFGDSKAVGAYFGLVPCQDQSGNSNRLGHITREGSATVRHLLTEAAWQAVRRSPTVAAYFARIQRDDPERKKIAVVATAHYLVRVMWALLKHGTLWQERAGASEAA